MARVQGLPFRADLLVEQRGGLAEALRERVGLGGRTWRDQGHWPVGAGEEGKGALYICTPHLGISRL